MNSNEVHSVTLILYEEIRYHNSKVTLHYIKFLNMSYHYITLHSGCTFQLHTIILPLKWGKFKLAKQQFSNFHPEVLLFHSKY